MAKVLPGPRHDHEHRAAPPRPGPARRAAEPLAWWTVLLAVYLGLVSAISVSLVFRSTVALRMVRLLATAGF